jgi:hypothetical protein
MENLMRKLILISLLIPLFAFCEKRNTNVIPESIIINSDNQNYENLQSMKVYRGTEDIFAPNGKMLRVYNSETMETPWGPIYAPIIYLYDIEKNALAKYDIIDLVSDNFWGGNIDITYNEERNSFDMVFSLDAYGNYGTAYIDLNTNKFVRELLIIPDERNIQTLQHQGIPDDYIEGANLKKRKGDGL